MCENLVWIGWNRRYVNFQVGGRSPLLGGLHVTCDAHFRTWQSYSSRKSCVKVWFILVEPFKSYRGNFPPKKIMKKKYHRLGGEGLHLTCDTHFRTRLTYSSQKSCVKIWFGLVEIGSMLILRGVVWGRSPVLERVTCDLWCPFLYTVELFQWKVMCENLVRIGWAFQELSW